MTQQVAIRLPDDLAADLDAAVAAGAFPSRSAAITAAARRLVAEWREEQIGALYRQAYGSQAEAPEDTELLDAAMHAVYADWDRLSPWNP